MLGGRNGEEIIYILYRTDLLESVPLSDYLFTREDIYGENFKFNNVTEILSRNSDTLGKNCLQSFKTQGYLRLQLTCDEQKAVDDAISAFKEFTNLSKSQKEEYAYTSIKSAQPQFGYRSTALHKEYFVCREIQGLTVTDDNNSEDCILKYPSEYFEKTIIHALKTLNAISRKLLKTILHELYADPQELDCIMNGLSLPSDSIDTFGFTDMMEIFRYDCSQSKNTSQTTPENLFPESVSREAPKSDEKRFRIPCGDHRDVALFTIIPKCRGPSGLEVYDWEGGWTNVEEQIEDGECIVLAGELLHRLTAGKICPTSHRVIIELSSSESDENDRYSSPCELLLNPLYKIDCQKLYPNEKISENFKCIETSQDYISRTSQKLVSVNK